MYAVESKEVLHAKNSGMKDNESSAIMKIFNLISRFNSRRAHPKNDLALSTVREQRQLTMIASIQGLCVYGASLER